MLTAGLGELADELQVALVSQTSRQPQEGLLEVVVAPSELKMVCVLKGNQVKSALQQLFQASAPGTEVVVLQIPLPVKLDVLGLAAELMPILGL